MNPVAFRASLLRAARNDRPPRETAERVLAAALLASLEACTQPPERPRRYADLLHHLFVPLAVLTLAGDPSPPLRSSPPPPPRVEVVTPPPVPAISASAPVLILSFPPAVASPPPPPSELTLLSRARAALPAYPALAQATLATHARLYPGGLLREEAEALRVDALFASNDLPATRLAAARFLAAHPGSPYAQRMRTVAAHAAAHDE